MEKRIVKKIMFMSDLSNSLSEVSSTVTWNIAFMSESKEEVATKKKLLRSSGGSKALHSRDKVNLGASSKKM